MKQLPASGRLLALIIAISLTSIPISNVDFKNFLAYRKDGSVVPKVDEKGSKIPTRATNAKVLITKHPDERSNYSHVASKIRPSSTTASFLVTTTEHTEIAKIWNHSSTVLVEPNDFIYRYEPYSSDKAPIVIESHKLVFFTVAKVGCTVWKKLFRRMMGFSNWLSLDDKGGLHLPARSGLKFLWNYSTENATKIMNDPNWTKAIFVRDPKERLLSAYLDKAVSTDYFVKQCCRTCGKHNFTFQEFIDFSQKNCKDNNHWIPQSRRIDKKFWNKIQFIGHLETGEADSERLLRQIGAWEKFGANGWGKKRKIFAGNDVVLHATSKTAESSIGRLASYYTPEIERQVEKIYEDDYANPVLNFTKYKIPF